MQQTEPGIVVPEGGFVAPPPIPQPNLYPIEWRVETPKLVDIYERSKIDAWNPSDLSWGSLDPEQFTWEERVGLMYWFALLANFDASGPAVFARATIHAFETHEEDPIRKCFFSITRDEMNHEECAQRFIQKFVPGGPLDWTPRTPLEQAARNNIEWLYHNGGRYWNGYNQAILRYPLAVLFTSFMMGEVASSTLFLCLTLLEHSWPGLRDEYKPLITKQLRAGFVFLSMVLWEPPPDFWQLPPYYLANQRVLVDIARHAGLGVLTFDEQAENWRVALARVRQIISRWDIEFPAIPELDIDGVPVGDIQAEDIIPVF